MILKTRGIVLNHTDYGETSIVVHVFTESLGRQSYIVNSVRSPKKKNMLALLQPLTLLDMEVYHKSKHDLHRIKEIKVNTPYRTIPFHPARRAIALFLTELLSKSLRNEAAAENLFEFLTQSLLALDEGIPGESNFHLFFMIQLTRFLGFFPQKDDDMPYFDLMNGVYTPIKPQHNHHITGNDLKIWNQLTGVPLDRLHDLSWNSSMRQMLISNLETLYQLHLPGFGHLNSHLVLHQLFK